MEEDELPPSQSYIDWLESQSMLYQASVIAKDSAETSTRASKIWSYSKPQTEQVLDLCDVWLAAYPPSVVTAPGESILSAMADEKLWNILSDIGINGIHTGPIKKAGGIVMGKKEFMPTCDGWFDRISFDVDPSFGEPKDLVELMKVTAKYNVSVLGDIVPGHSGLGADFLLALLNYKNYASMYCLTSIEEKHWAILPEVPKGDYSLTLSFATAEELLDLGYLPGHPQRCIFSVPGEPPKTCYDATGPIKGVDGIVRRWVFLHYFKPGQPAYDWLDPNFGPGRIQLADIIISLKEGFRVLRLDASPFLGLEQTEERSVESEVGPIARHVSDTLAWNIRKNGGWSFQEIVHDIDHIRDFAISGSDLSYDFILRPAYLHSLLTGDASFLKTMLKEMEFYQVNPKALIHALQTHDDFTYELVHLISHGSDLFNYRGDQVRGSELRETILNQMLERLSTARTPYIGFSGNGVCTTTVGWIAASIGVKDPYRMSEGQRNLVQRAHLLLAAFNALQPGVFAISSWDLIGALPLRPDSVSSLTDIDGDWRWILRGAVDLVGSRRGSSMMGLPQAKGLYGSLSQQLELQSSFTSQVRGLIEFRRVCGISKGAFVELLESPDSVSAVLYSIPRSNEPSKAELHPTERISTQRYLLIAINWSLGATNVALRHPILAKTTPGVVFPQEVQVKSAKGDSIEVSLPHWSWIAVTLNK